MADNQNNKKAVYAFAAAFGKAAGEALSKAMGSQWPLQRVDGGGPLPPPGHPIHFRLAVDGRLRGECFVEFYEPQASQLAARILGRPPVDDEHAEALAKVLASAVAGLREELASEYGELSLQLSPVHGLAFGGMFVVPLTASADPLGAPVLLYFDGQLLDALSAPPAADPAAAPGHPGIDALNLKLVMDVELNVCLRFGQRQLPLREVLELSSGSVIELDSMVDDPVELLLDGKLIARGEAVIVDGNYGLRVTEIPHPIASHFQR